MIALPSAEELILCLTPMTWPSIYAVRAAEREVTEALGRTFPNSDAVVDLVNSAVDWRAFVAKVVRGYDHYLDDYVDEFSGRRTLDKILRALRDDELAAKAREAVGIVDDVFRAHTRVSKKRVWNLEVVDSDIYWRIPKTLYEPLQDDLRRGGYLE